MNKLSVIGAYFLTFIPLVISASCNKKPEGEKVKILNTIVMEKNSDTISTATFGNGCFWCTEAIFQQLKGVSSVLPGFSGGTIKNPSYKEVCTGTTGHAEAIQIKFNPQVISYGQLLEVFFKTHDPTTLNRQGNDVGTQYRSVIFYHSADQKSIAEQAIEKLNSANIWNNPIVTQIVPFEAFYEAEDYHKDYYINNKNQPYCRLVITPKIEKFQKVFSEMLKEK